MIGRWPSLSFSPKKLQTKQEKEKEPKNLAKHVTGDNNNNNNGVKSRDQAVTKLLPSAPFQLLGCNLTCRNILKRKVAGHLLVCIQFFLLTSLSNTKLLVCIISRKKSLLFFLKNIANRVRSPFGRYMEWDDLIRARCRNEI